MKALLYKDAGNIKWEEIKTPRRSGNQYLIKIMANGICGSDIEGFTGRSGRRTAPMIMGHEFSGIIVEKPDNGRYERGMKVTAFPKLFCGECEICQKGLVNICPGAPCLGVMDCNGTMTEFISVDEKYIIPLKEETEFEAATLIEPLAVAVRGVENIPESVLMEAENILIIGAGTIGLLVIQAIRFKGFKKNLAINDKSDFRLSRALSMGADKTFTGKNFEKEVSEASKGEKFDVVIECVGLDVTARASLNALKSGGTAIWIGNNQKNIEINMQQIVTSELKIVGSYTYTLKEFTRAKEIIEKGTLNYRPIITKKIALEKGEEAFKLLADNKEGKEIKILLMNE